MKHSSPLRDIANVPKPSDDGHRKGKQQKLIDTNFFGTKDYVEPSKGAYPESRSRSAVTKDKGKVKGKDPVSAPVHDPPLSKRPTLLRG
jgi:hypothetical protein